MLINEEVKTRVTSNMVSYYKDKGYSCSVGEYIYVKISDLMQKSNVKIRYICDKCGKIFETRYCDYNRRHDTDIDLCPKCKYEKTKKTNMSRYGCENVMQNEEIKKLVGDTNIKRYGCKSAMGNNDILDMVKKKWIEKYGVDNPAKTDAVKDKISKTDMERYGVKHHLSSRDVMAKRIKTNMDKYGVPHGLMSKDVIEKSRKSLYKNGSCPTSKQQKHIHEVYGGELNYPIGRTNVDIFFTDENIYFEYDGGGHRYMVFSKMLTDEEFNRREIRRSKYLKSIGLKEFRIISRNDIIPTDDILINIKNFAFNKLLNDGYDWIKFDIDNNRVYYPEHDEPYMYNHL